MKKTQRRMMYLVVWFFGMGSFSLYQLRVEGLINTFDFRVMGLSTVVYLLMIMVLEFVAKDESSN